MRSETQEVFKRCNYLFILIYLILMLESKKVCIKPRDKNNVQWSFHGTKWKSNAHHSDESVEGLQVLKS